MPNTAQIITHRIPDEDPDTSYLEQEGFEDRLESYRRGDFYFLGIVAKTQIAVCGTIQTLQSGGLWGIESDSDESYLQEIEREQIAELQAIEAELTGDQS